jgi:hypothetical protein
MRFRSQILVFNLKCPCMPKSDAVVVHLIHLFAQPVENVDSLKDGGTRNER